MTSGSTNDYNGCFGYYCLFMLVNYKVLQTLKVLKVLKVLLILRSGETNERKETLNTSL